MALTLAELAALDKYQRLLVAEVEAKRALESETWTLESGVVYYFDVGQDEDVFKATIAELGTGVGVVEMTEYFSVSDVQSNADSFYYNPWTKRLYVHTTDSDDPATLVSGDPKYSIVIHFWVAFSNRAKSIKPTIQKLLDPGLDWWDSATTLMDWTEQLSGTSTVTREATTVDGDKSAYSAKLTVDGSGNDVYIWQRITLRPGGKARYRIRFATASGSNVGHLIFRDSTATVNLQTDGSWDTLQSKHYFSGSSLAFQTLELEFAAHPDYSIYDIIILADVADAVIYFDNSRVDEYRLSRPCKPLIPPDGMPNITQSVGDYYRPDEQIQIGILRLIDGFFFTDHIDDYFWTNSKVKIWLAQLADVYEDFTPFGAGITNLPRAIPGFVEFEIGDPRIELKPLPLTDYRFDSGTYPNVKSDWLDKPVPVLLGNFQEVKPPCCDTTAFKYKLGQTVFFGTTYNFASVTEVREVDSGFLLATPGDYTVDLTTGIIDCAIDHEPDGIYVAGTALEVDFDSAGTYAWQVEDFLYFYFVICNKFSRDDLDRLTLKALTDDRLIGMFYLLKEEKTYQEILSDWKITNIFQIYYGLDGKYYFPFYAESVPTDAPHFFDSHYEERPVLYKDTDQCFKSITCKADWREYSERYDNIDTVESEIAEARHGVTKQIELETFTYSSVTNLEIANNLLSMHENPPEVLEVAIKKESALLLNPTDKFYATWREKDKNGTYHYKLNDVVFRVLSIEKDINRGVARIKALRDVSDFWNVFT